MVLLAQLINGFFNQPRKALGCNRDNGNPSGGKGEAIDLVLSLKPIGTRLRTVDLLCKLRVPWRK